MLFHQAEFDGYTSGFSEGYVQGSLCTHKPGSMVVADLLNSGLSIL